MANFVYGGVAIAAGAPANCRTLNLACASFFYLSVLKLFTSIKLLFANKHKANRLHFLSMAVDPKLGLKPGFKLSFKLKST